MSELKHLGIIADGNRRWAKAHGLPTIEGHRRGIDTIEALVKGAAEAGIEYVTFYVFSTENWGRSKDEVGYLMKLVETQIVPYARKLAKMGAKLIILGSREGLPTKLEKLLQQAEEITADGTKITVCFCFNYGGEQEIADAATAAAKELADGARDPKDRSGDSDGGAGAKGSGAGEITPEMIRAHLYHPEVPDVDLVVRTSGEERISGFMLWRSSYAEFLFLEKFFPEMSEADVPEIVAEFEKRQRRFGK